MTGSVAVTAVSKPKERPTKLRSLSIVFGTPTTLIESLRRLHSSAIARVLLAARGAEDGAAEGVDRVDGVGVEQERGEVLFGDEALVAVADAVDRLDAVVEGEDLDDALDDVVQARAEAAGREDGGAAPGGVVEDLGVGAGLLEGGRLDAARLERLGLADVGREVDALALLDEEGVTDGRVTQALAEVVDVEVVVLRVGDDVCQYAHGGSLDDA